MPTVKRIVLDVLKPHHPNALELANTLAALDTDWYVSLRVTAVDEKTESAQVTIEGSAVEFAAVREALERMGANVHSIDEVEVDGASGPGEAPPPVEPGGQ